MKKSIVLAVALLACGPSSSELKTAHETTYKGPTATLFAAAKAATTEAHYKVLTSDEANLKLATEPQWYTPEGQLDTASVGNNISQYQEDSINLSFIVEFANAGTDAYKVAVTEIVLRKHGLSSNPEKMDPDDPAVPPWVGGKANALTVSIHDRLKPYAVTGTSTNGTMPTAAPTPAPAPATPTEPAPAPAP